MNREFLEFYDNELKMLYERGKEFAEDYPSVAGRLGGLIENQVDPTIAGLMEGAAFLAARVQLKLKSEFDTFTTEMIENLVPGFLAPVPSFAMLRVEPDYSNPALKQGLKLRAGDYVDTTFVESQKRTSLRYRLVTGIDVWPYAITKAEFFSTLAPLQARGLNSPLSVAGGLFLEFQLKSPAVRGEGAGDPVKSCTPDMFTVHLTDSLSDAASLHELLFSRLSRIVIRHGRDGEAPKFASLPPQALEEVGFEEGQSLFGHDNRLFGAFNHLREYFAFPHRFLGFRLKGLQSILKSIESDRFEVYFELESVSKRLSSVVKDKSFALYVAPAANLFEVTCAPVPIRSQDHEHVVIADRSRPLDHEIYRIIDVSAQYPRRKDRVPVYPLYSAPAGNVPVDKAHFYTSRRLERRKTDVERRTGLVSTYLGTDTFISLKEPPEEEGGERVRALNVRALVTNRHMTDQVPVKRGQTDFTAVEDKNIRLECIAGPTPPRESPLSGSYREKGAEATGSLMWKLLSILQFNHLGLSGGVAGERAGALRELLMVFADAANPDIEKRIRGILDVQTAPVVRKIRQDNGFNAARGIQVTIEFDEMAFEGTGVFLLGTVLSRFLSEYASMNSFVETVIRSRQRNEIMRWKPVIGARPTL